MASMMQKTGSERRMSADKERDGANMHGMPAAEGHVMSIHKSGSGGYTATHEDGSKTEHEHMHGAMAEAGSRHMGGMHHMTHHDGMGGGFTTHHASHGESANGPNEHGDLESVHDEMNQTMGGGSDEDEYEPEGGGKMMHSGMMHEGGKDY